MAHRRFEVLDGWRGISILLVIAGHWLPLGPSDWFLNKAIAGTGMVIFFIMSGFLITNLLIRDQNIITFLIRRFMRIIPLAWPIIIIILFFNQSSLYEWCSNILFYANLPPMSLVDGAKHFWSLCAEIQFYLLISLLVGIFKKKAFLLLPIICITVTAWRVYNGEEMNIRTYYRLDEILAGCMLALLYSSNFKGIKRIIGKLSTPIIFIVLIASANPFFGWLNYLRLYIACLLVGSTLFISNEKWWIPFLKSRILFYIASISYALYLFHTPLASTWLGQGEPLVKYAKRPLLLLVTLVLAHISTNYYESYWIIKGKQISAHFKKDSVIVR